MSDFEFFLSFYGLLLGLSLAEVATKFADAIGARHRVRIGVMTPALAVFVLFDICTLWLWAWADRAVIKVTWGGTFAGLVIAMTYFLAAALIFPREPGEWTSLDDYYWKHKRFVVGGVVIANLLQTLVNIRINPAVPIGDPIFWVWTAGYFGPLAVLLVSRSRRLDLAMIGVELLQYLVGGLSGA